MLPAPTDTQLFKEAASSPRIIAQQADLLDPILRELGERLHRYGPRWAITCARGSSAHAASYAKYLLETQLGLPTATAIPSSSHLYHAPLRLEHTLYLVISQSGASPDLLENAERARQAGAFVVALVNQTDSPLAQLAHHVVPIGAGPELAVAATKSFLATLTALLRWVAQWREELTLQRALHELPEQLEQAWALDWQALEQWQLAEHLFVVGRGPGLAIAQEAALKLKETAALHAEAFSSAELQHGPMTLAGPQFPVLIFNQNDAAQQGTHQLALALQERQTPVLLVDELATPETRLAMLPNVHPDVAPLLMIHRFYRSANALALARGHHPDQPPHLHKVTCTR